MTKIDYWKRAQERLAEQGKTLAPLTPPILAEMYPEVVQAHAQFGGDLADMLRQYHRAALEAKP